MNEIIDPAGVPASWFALVGGVLVASFIWWLKREFDRNDREHHALGRDHRSVMHGLIRLDAKMNHLMSHMEIPSFQEPVDLNMAFDEMKGHHED